MDFRKQNPIYMQIADTLCERIMAGEWQAEERMPSVRDVAAGLGVNPNTALRAFDYLQGNDIIHSRRGEGYYLSPEAEKAVVKLHRRQFMEDEVPYFLSKMKMLGITWQELQEAEER